MTNQELKTAVEADRKERAEACAAEVEAALKKYDCILDATIQVRGNIGKAIPMVVAK